MHDVGASNDTHTSYIPTAKRKPVIVCGDLNVAATPLDLRHPERNRNNAGFTDQERAKFAALLESGFVDTYRHLYPEYSWWSYMRNARASNAGWRIDYFLISEFAKDRIKEARIHTDIYGSDHCPVGLIIDL